jgi:hypothetical protein
MSAIVCADLASRANFIEPEPLDTKHHVLILHISLSIGNINRFTTSRGRAKTPRLQRERFLTLTFLIRVCIVVVVVEVRRNFLFGPVVHLSLHRHGCDQDCDLSCRNGISFNVACHF